MQIKTTRFGNIEIKLEDVVSFPEGILGFADLRKFVLLDDPNDDIFAWLQSCEAAHVAFPVLEPELFVPDYKVNLTKSDQESLKLSADNKPLLFSIVTIPEDPTLMTANLKAPVVVNVKERMARQCVLQDNSLAIREPIFAKLQQRVVQFPQKTIKSQSHSLDVAVRLVSSESNSSDSSAEL